MARKPVTIEHLDALIARNKSRLKRTVTVLDKLRKQRKRVVARAAFNKAIDMDVNAELAKLTIRPPTTPPGFMELAGAGIERPVVKTPENSAAVAPAPKDDGLDIPTFLSRPRITPEAQQILDEQAALKKRKAAGRIATMKAKQSGETRRMPLSGRAAREALKNT